MLFSGIILCLLLMFIEILTLYKSKKFNELKIYLTFSTILLTIAFLGYIQIIPRHLLKYLSNLFNLI